MEALKTFIFLCYFLQCMVQMDTKFTVVVLSSLKCSTFFMLAISHFLSIQKKKIVGLNIEASMMQ